MARKDLLKGLMNTDDAAHDTPAPSVAPSAGQSETQPKRATYTKGAIGAVSRSISELKSRSVTDIPTDLIDDTGGLKDRLAEDDADRDALMQSIRDYGQQVPVLLRHDPNNEGRYQVVYGRRRVAALRALGLPVKALLRDLNDQDLVMAQGQENAARRDLTFIEKANFARQMRDAGFKRKLICDALHIDKTVISRMLHIADTLGEDVIRAIGPAPSVGRDRWLKLAGLVENGTSTAKLVKHLGTLNDLHSDARFDELLAQLSVPKPKPKRTSSAPLMADGQKVGGVARTNKVVTLTLQDKDFGDWLAQNINDIHRSWSDSKSGE